MRNHRHIDKSKRPSFSSNEELERYLADRAEQCEQEKEDKRLWAEECRRRREEAYKHEPTEIEVMFHFDSPLYSEDGKALNSFRYTYGYNKKYTVNDGVETIGIFAFHMNRELVQIKLPPTLKIIAEFAFSGCGIKEIIIPEGVSIIQSSTFKNCFNLEKVVLPSTIIEIQNHAFEDCPLLREINIPEGCIIEWRVFPDHLPELQKLEMPWEEMHVYEEWKKTHKNISGWTKVRENLIEKYRQQEAKEKAKRDAEHERWKRKRENRWKYRKWYDLWEKTRGVLLVIICSPLIVICIIPLLLWGIWGKYYNGKWPW